MGILNFAGLFGSDTRPARVSAGRKAWAKDPSGPGASDGTRLDATFVNDLRGMIIALAMAASLPDDPDDDLLENAIRYLAHDTTPAPHIHDDRYYTETEIDNALVLKVSIAQIVDNLTSGGAAVPLSAEQGKVLKTQLDGVIAAATGALVFKGSWDASAGTFPGGGTAQQGFFYKVSVAGTVNGVPFTVGDDLYAIVNNASTSTYAANWQKIEGGITSAEVVAALGFTPLAPANNLSELTNAGTARTNLALGGLAVLSSITASLISDASANGRSLIQAANYAAMKTLLAIAIADVSGLQAALTALTVGIPVLGRNRLINPYFVHMQRGASPLAVTDGLYCFDRWYFLTDATNGTAQQAIDPNPGYLNSALFFHGDGSAKRFGAAQIIEGKRCRDLRSKQVTLTARVSFGSGFSSNIRMAIIEWTGTEDAAVKDVVNNWASGTFTTGNFFKATSTVIAACQSFPLPGGYGDLTLQGTLSANVNNLIVFIWSEAAVNTSEFLEIAAVQLEEGAAFTSFERRDFDDELARCQRYYEAHTQTLPICKYRESDRSRRATMQWKKRKRVSPTVISTYTADSAGALTTTPSVDGVFFSCLATADTNAPTVSSITGDAEIGV